MEKLDLQKIKTWLGHGSINVFGRPFSGKDTQAKKLADCLQASVIGGGEIIRNSQNISVKKVIDSGYLAPTKSYLDMILPYFSQDKFIGKPLVLSSVGRWHGEEQHVMKALENSAHPLRAVIHLDIEESEVKTRYEEAKRLGDRGRRADDAHGILAVRLEEFRTKTNPVLKFYENKGLLITVDGSQSPKEVFNEIIQQLLTKST